MGLGGSGWGRPAPTPRRPATPVRRPVREDPDQSSPTRSPFFQALDIAQAPYSKPAFEGWQAADGNRLWFQGQNPFGAPTQSGTGGGGGGGGGYGGGGGGGGSGVTQAMIDAMIRTLGIMPQNQTYKDVKLPGFQGQNIAPFDPTLYNLLSQQLTQGLAADKTNIATNQAAVTNTLQQNYQDPYASAQVVQGAPAPQVGGALAASVGGDTGAVQQAGQVTAGADANSMAAFQNLYNVLSANSQQSQSSRMNQVAMDANSARQGLDAQGRALSGQIGMQRAGAQQQWQQQDSERRYQNNLMQQQWAREQAQTNALGRQAVQQTNVQTRNDAAMARIQPLLDLIASSGGSGVNLAGLNALLGRLGG